jgi:hypothetical protein
LDSIADTLPVGMLICGPIYSRWHDLAIHSKALEILLSSPTLIIGTLIRMMV